MSDPVPSAPLRQADSGGFWEVLRIAFPLIMVNAGQAIKLFCDRILLSWHSEAAVAAAFTAGMTYFLCLTLFFGICGYAATFVAQYTGAGRDRRIGQVVWQAVWVALAAGMLLATGPWWADGLFRLIGHDPLVRRHETVYFSYLILGAIAPLLVSALAAFWVGRGKTWTIVVLQAVCIVANLLANWWFIFGTEGCHELSRRAAQWRAAAETPWTGHLVSLAAAGAEGAERLLNAGGRLLGLPAMGTVGSAIATVGTDLIGVAFLMVLFLRPHHRRVYGTWPARIFDGELLRRIIRFGLPNGAQFFVDIFAFNTFGILMGLYSPAVHFAATVAFSMNAICVMPMIGLANAGGVLVGQSIGAGDIGHAQRSVRSARRLIVGYIVVVAAVRVFTPGPVSGMFASQGADAARQGELLALANDFLKYVAAYLVFDGLFFLYANAIRGAGDTKFSLYAMLALAVFGLLAPCILAFRLGAGPHTLWAIMVAYVVVSAVVFYWRYHKGHWQRMRVIEDAPPPPDPGPSTGVSGRFVAPV